MDIQERFAEEGIEIPYPKRDVYIKGIVERESSERKLSEKDLSERDLS
jgi:small-conductance mechanosensitive channel